MYVVHPRGFAVHKPWLVYISLCKSPCNDDGIVHYSLPAFFRSPGNQPPVKKMRNGLFTGPLQDDGEILQSTLGRLRNESQAAVSTHQRGTRGDGTASRGARTIEYWSFLHRSSVTIQMKSRTSGEHRDMSSTGMEFVGSWKCVVSPILRMQESKSLTAAVSIITLWLVNKSSRKQIC